MTGAELIKMIGKVKADVKDEWGLAGRTERISRCEVAPLWRVEV